MGCVGSKDSDVPQDEPGEKKTENIATSDGIITKPVDAGASETDVVVSLGGEKIERVKSLFGVWDLDAQGKLELAAFTGAIVQVGPIETKVLARLADMDVDKDGFVTLEEWLKWFTETATALNGNEFDLIMEEMEASAEEMVTLIRCTRLAAEAQAVPLDADEVGPPPLEPKRAEAVQALFKAWDFEGTGSIDRLKVTATAVSFGPHKSQILKQLESMDTDGDNLITLDEMSIFFQVVSADLTDAGFTAVVGEMTELAQEAGTIAACLQMADAGVGYVEGDEAEKLTLSDARTELVTKLFTLFTPSTADTIDVVSLDQITVKEGPYTSKLLTDLKTMDANGDGKLEFGEMVEFFAAIGAALSDEEFELIVGEMIETCESAQLAAQLAALANS